MASEVTNFQRPSPETEYDELQPLIVKSGKPPVIIDPNDPPVTPEKVNCCTCTGSLNQCIPEQISGNIMTVAGGQGFAYYFM